MKKPELWQKINEFEFDNTNSEFNFSSRLARDNNWTIAYSLRVLLEYKRYLYLCCADYGPITPSDAVDQAWHLHLTYTKSYWKDLCQNTLEKEIHHNPTKGGKKEREKYKNCYDATFTAYEAEFGTTPPQDIWPNNNSRFSQINFKRINLSGYWLIKKPVYNPSYLIIPIAIFTIVLFIQSENSVPWVSLIFCFLLFLFIVRAARKSRRGKRGGGSNGTDTGGLWGGFWGCSSDDSGCSNDGCSSGCSGCGGD